MNEKLFEEYAQLVYEFHNMDETNEFKAISLYHQIIEYKTLLCLEVLMLRLENCAINDLSTSAGSMQY